VAEQIASMEIPAPVPKRPVPSTGRRPRTAAERAVKAPGMFVPDSETQGASRGLPTEPVGAPTAAGAADAAPPPSALELPLEPSSPLSAGPSPSAAPSPRAELLHRIDVATARLYGLHRGPAASAVYSDHGFDQSSRPQAWLGQLGTEQLERLADDLDAKL
jgi:hypothetical protein